MVNHATLEEAIQHLDRAISCVTAADLDPEVEYRIYTKIEDIISRLEIVSETAEA
jgi:hypothetical protein